jgi:hypothetical protein
MSRGVGLLSGVTEAHKGVKGAQRRVSGNGGQSSVCGFRHSED